MAVTHIGVDAGRIGPIGFDGNDGKAVLLDQALRDRGTGAVEFRSAMGRLAEKHDFGIGKAVEHSAERIFIGNRRQGFPMLAHKIDGFLDGGVVLALLPGQPGHGFRSARPAPCVPAPPENDRGTRLVPGDGRTRR
jgi:hypothetical protein